MMSINSTAFFKELISSYKHCTVLYVHCINLKHPHPATLRGFLYKQHGRRFVTIFSRTEILSKTSTYSNAKGSSIV